MVTPMPTAAPFEDAQGHLAAAVARIGVAVIDLAVGEPLHRTALGVAVEGVGAGRQIGPGAEAAAGAGDDDGADVVVAVGLIEGVDQFLLHGGVEGIEVFRPVQRDGEDLVLDLVGDCFVGHRAPLIFCFFKLNNLFRTHTPHPEERPLGRVSKDGRACCHPSRRAQRARSSG
jgi:hypothetical protein